MPLLTHMSSSSMPFEDMLPRLVTAYDQGMLVPFLGAGMSRNLCPGWSEFIAALEAKSATPGVLRQNTLSAQTDDSPAVLIRRANSAVRQLSLRDLDERSKSIRDALYSKNVADNAQSFVRHLPQTEALAKLHWPLVLSSNYDDLFARSYVRQRQDDFLRSFGDAEASQHEMPVRNDDVYQGHLSVRGRSRSHCAEVLDSLSTTIPSVLWAIHGFLPSESVDELKALEKELVVGHDEYRRLAHADPYYRRTFGEVWRRRSLLFIGSGLGDPYLLELFSEIQEIYGTTPQPHFAIIGPESEVDTEHLRSRFNILVTRLKRLSELPKRLNTLASHVESGHTRQVQWDWNLNVGPKGTNTSADLTIRHGALPETPLGSHEGIVVSAGFMDAALNARTPFVHGRVCRAVGQAIRRTKIDSTHFSPVHRVLSIPVEGVFKIPKSKAWAIQPWNDASTRNLTLITRQLEAVFSLADSARCTSLRMNLLGGGASRHFPAVVPLALIIRAFRSWRIANSQSTLKITVFVLDETAIFELRSGRLDVTELLAAEDIRVWIRVFGPEVNHALAEPIYLHEDVSLRNIAVRIGLPQPARWHASISPSAVADAKRISADSNDSLASLGVVPGATISLRRS